MRSSQTPPQGGAMMLQIHVSYTDDNLYKAAYSFMRALFWAEEPGQLMGFMGFIAVHGAAKSWTALRD